MFHKNIVLWIHILNSNLSLDPSYDLSKAILHSSLKPYKPKFYNETLFCPYQDDSCAISLRKQVCIDSLEQKKDILQVNAVSYTHLTLPTNREV